MLNTITSVALALWIAACSVALVWSLPTPVDHPPTASSKAHEQEEGREKGKTSLIRGGGGQIVSRFMHQNRDDIKK